METQLVTALIILLPVLFAVGYFIGKGTIKDSEKPKRIEEYEFYPFITNELGIVEFSQKLFNEAVTPGDRCMIYSAMAKELRSMAEILEREVNIITSNVVKSIIEK